MRVVRTVPLSDRVIERMAGDPRLRGLARTCKGLALVVVTALLLFLLLRRVAAERERLHPGRRVRCGSA